MSKLKFFLLGLCMIFAFIACEDPTGDTDTGTGTGDGALYKAGTYTAKKMGYKYLTLSVAFNSDKITDIKILEENETPQYSDRHIPSLPEAIVKAQSTNVDVVAGATQTATAIILAVEDAIKQAKAAL